MRKNFYIKSLFYLALTFILCTCNDPVFYAISLEVKPVEPQIKGVPTNFVIYDGRMHVASGDNIYEYDKNAEQNKTLWSKEVQPGGNILQIAATSNYLYSLCSTDQDNNGKTVIKRFDEASSSWSQIGGILNDIEKINNIFATDDILFITAKASSTYYAISHTTLYIDNDNPETANELIITGTDQSDTGEINGVAFDGKSYFLSAKDRGVYKIDDFDEGALLIKYKDTDGNDVNINFLGIINLQDEANTILLIARNGDIYTVKDTITKIENVSMDKMATGTLAIWRENDQPSCNRLLLAGRQDSLSYSYSYGYTYGYLELELDISGIKNGKNFVEPGKEPLSTVRHGDNERYQSTIGKNPVNYLFQVPPEIDSEMILFASTQKNGVWSYRDRNGIFQWNAE